MRLSAVSIKHERRVRLVFTASLGAGAFLPSLYLVASLDGKGASPLVSAVYALTSDPAAVELQLSADLVTGARYSFSALAVPDVDANATPNPDTVTGYFGSPAVPPQAQQRAGSTELAEILYGRDLRYEAGDLVEDQQGDLATVAGPGNLEAALWRRGLSEGLPWDGTYGGQLRQYVDGNAGGLLPARARMEQQMRQDDRVSQVRATVTTSQDDAAGYVSVEVKPIGAGEIQSIKIPVALT